MKPKQILKKQIEFYLEEPLDTAGLEQDKLNQINKKISAGSKNTLANELIFSIGNIILGPAHHLVLENQAAEGWTKFDRGIAWLSGFIKKSSPTSFSLTDEPFAAVVGMSWLYNKKDMMEEAVTLLRRRFDQKKEAAHSHVLHKELLLSLYDIYFNNKESELATDFLQDDHIYKRLISNIHAPNEQYMPLIEEACDYHLLYTPLMANKNPIEFSHFELVPYEILCLVKTREKLGFDIPTINHELMKTPLAQVQPELSTYTIESDQPLQLILRTR